MERYRLPVSHLHREDTVQGSPTLYSVSPLITGADVHARDLLLNATFWCRYRQILKVMKSWTYDQVQV